MEQRSTGTSRRKFFAQAAALTLTTGVAKAESAERTRPNRSPVPQPPAAQRRPIAMIATVVRPLSQAQVLGSRFLHGYLRDGQVHMPAFRLASLHVEQVPENDLSRQLAREFDVRRVQSVSEALSPVDGSKAIEGVLVVAEHGNYPRNERGQVLYPRQELLSQVVEVFRRTGRVAPVYFDRVLSHEWIRARQMVSWSTELGFPMLAGSALPWTWRRPELDLPLDTPIEEGLVVGHGQLEAGGFDGLEALQALLERRAGGEKGVSAVTCLTGEAVWKAGERGLWSRELLEAALARSETAALGDPRRHVGVLNNPGQPRLPATAILVDYSDGCRASVLLLNGVLQDFCFAGRLGRGQAPVSCLFVQPGAPGFRQFDCLVEKIERLFLDGKSPSPIERNLLTTGILEAALESHARRGDRMLTSHLGVCYQAPGVSEFRRGSVVFPG